MCVEVLLVALCLGESLKWESIEQTFFWKLFQAHNFKTENWMFELLQVVDLRKHPEAAMFLIENIKDKPYVTLSKRFSMFY